MSIIKSSGAGEVSTGFYPFEIDQSLRFNDGSSAYLTRTPSGDGNLTTWTWSGWFKIGTDPTLYHTFFTGNTNYDQLRFDPSSRIVFGIYENGTNRGSFTTQREFRDMSNWYHIVAVWDTDNSTANDRQRLYINGVRQLTADLTVGVTPSSGRASQINSGGEQISIGRRESTNSLYLDGYLAEINFLDGTAVSHTQNSDGDYILDELGEVKNGVWIPKEYTGSYGTNGFRLDFADSSDIGKDVSGNSNNFTPSGFDATDVVFDSPTNNGMTFNFNHRADTSISLREASLHAHCDSDDGVFTTMEIPTSGKWYVEILLQDASKPMGVYIMGNQHRTRDDWTHASNYTSFFEGFSIQGSTNKVFEYGGTEIGGAGSHSAGTIYAFLIDVDNSTYDIYQNDTKILDAGTFNHPGSNIGAIIGVGNNSDSGTNDADFHLNAGHDSSFNGQKTSGSSNESDANGIGDFYYSTKGGLAICSKNLPDVTIGPNSDTQAKDHFSTDIWSGNDSARKISLGFEADWVWTKMRSHTNAHYAFDSSRGDDKGIYPNLTQAEGTVSGSVSFGDSDGFDLGTNAQVNGSGYTYVGWSWKANGGTTSSNSDGSITSTVQANTTAGFSIVLYTGTGANATVGHGLGVAPKWILIKGRDTTNHWTNYHDSVGNTKQTYLSTSPTATTANSVYFNNTSPTSSVFSLGSDSYANPNGGTVVAYCFAEIEGYSKFGTYEANNNADGTFVYTGFRPAWLMTGDIDRNSMVWMIYDNVRDKFNQMDNNLIANGANAEPYSASGSSIDFYSNGFKFYDGSSSWNNYSTDTFIYMAFAEQPFKFSNAR